MYKVDDFVKNIVDTSDFSYRNIVEVCKRKNNKKRDFLFVDAYQGKHIPICPLVPTSFFQELVNKVKEKLNPREQVLVVGFAETATAIGNYLADHLPNCVYKLQTTRESYAKFNPIIHFHEEHSHAVDQWLFSVEELPYFTKVLFVEDEITTGKTILNFIEQFKGINPTATYMVASLLNWQNESDTKKYAELGVDTVCMINGEIRDIVPTIELNNVVEAHKPKRDDSVKAKYLDGSSPFGYMDERLGSVPSYAAELYVDSLYESVKCELDDSDYSVCVVGTEEFMYLPMLFGEKLAKEGFDTKFHATTRSPITIATDEGYAIHNGVIIASPYDKDRTTYLYNLDKYDKVFIVTDVQYQDAFAEDIANAFAEHGCNDVQIIIVM